ncbi:hypothetical protein JR316_0012283 [Psilocybe cubensis]|uniref:Uncharacterized protein n=2 Tax=Psilocybe cubensis TaxID=181762 RepID=A0ACB8GIF5_PSICU|nr:hypothetical protein JR316_0012283 [Psilocybe cubensis]KAH9475172.1 hypothetical protein JR316_0012283 [Psilocybe cubensis]
MPTVFFTRDRELDDTLESEAHLTLILVGVGLGILVIVTAAVYYGYRLVRILRPAWCFWRFSGPITNSADTVEVKRSESGTSEVNSLSVDMSMAQSKPSFIRRQTEPERTPPSSRIPSFFNSIRKNSSVSVPRQHTGVYTGTNNRSPFPGPPPAVRLNSPTTPTQSRFNSHGATPHTSPAQQGIVTPHIAAWMKVADSVVGRHPDAQPLSARVATQAEIDLISGHVHVPWAFNGPGPSGSQPPVPVKVMRPVLSAPASAIAPAIGQGHGQGQPQTQPPSTSLATSMTMKPRLGSSVLKDIGNLRGNREISTATVNKTSNSRSAKGKAAVRRAHDLGKENMPAVPSPLAQSGRHRTN